MLSLVVAETERAITTVQADAILRHRTDAMWLFVRGCGDRASKEKKASVQYIFWDKRTTKMRTRPPWTLSFLYLFACQVIVIAAAAVQFKSLVTCPCGKAYDVKWELL